jgi:hypothetical protein
MSGGPVLLVGQLDYPLVAVVSQFSLNLELLRLRTLSHVPSDFEKVTLP